MKHLFIAVGLTLSLLLWTSCGEKNNPSNASQGLSGGDVRTGQGDVNGTFNAPPPVADNITLTACGGGETATYCPGSTPTYTYYRVKGGGQITVCGYVRDGGVVVPNVDVTVTFYNPRYPSSLGGQRSVTVTTNSSGYYTATIPVGPAGGDYTCIFGSAIAFKHTYDIVRVEATSGSAFAQLKVYLLATDVRI